MPCPHFSSDDNTCRLIEEPPADDEELDTPADERVNREFCLSERKSYLDCPVFRGFLADLLH